MIMRNEMVEVKIMASEKIMVMPLVSDKCVCACLDCVAVKCSLMHFFHVMSLALSNFI